MNINWHPIERVFFAEFSADFAGDLEAVKAAGFKPLGVPPPWIWHAPSPGIKALTKLRGSRPASGLTISPEALAIYQPLAEQEEKNEVVRKQVAELKKQKKKEKKQRAQETGNCQIPEGKIWIEAEDLPPTPPFVSIFIPPPTPDLLCFVCQQPVYFYEYPDIPMCLWCAKNSGK